MVIPYSIILIKNLEFTDAHRTSYTVFRFLPLKYFNSLPLPPPALHPCIVPTGISTIEGEVKWSQVKSIVYVVYFTSSTFVATIRLFTVRLYKHTNMHVKRTYTYCMYSFIVLYKYYRERENKRERDSEESLGTLWPPPVTHQQGYSEYLLAHQHQHHHAAAVAPFLCLSVSLSYTLTRTDTQTHKQNSLIFRSPTPKWWFTPRPHKNFNPIYTVYIYTSIYKYIKHTHRDSGCVHV